MDLGAFLLLILLAAFAAACVAAALLSFAAACVAVRRASDPSRVSRGAAAGTVIGWVVTVGLGGALACGVSEGWWCCAAYPVGGLVAFSVARAIAPPLTITSVSPDGAFRVTLVDQPVFLEPRRNFEVWLDETGRGPTRVVLRTPYEGAPAGSERVVWAADGSRFLVLGRHFTVTDQGQLPAGEQAYLMMDVRSGEVWCNAAAPTAHPGFGAADLRAVDWLGWTPAEPAAADRPAG